MNNFVIRVWLLATITPAVIALLMRVVYEAYRAVEVGTWVVTILFIIVIIAVYAFLFTLAINPDTKKLKTKFFRASVSIIGTAAIISGIVHFIRFVPSSHASLPVSVPMAILLLLAGFSAYSLTLYILFKTGVR